MNEIGARAGEGHTANGLLSGRWSSRGCRGYEKDVAGIYLAVLHSIYKRGADARDCWYIDAEHV